MSQEIVNPSVAKWARLRPNQHCSLRVDREGTHRWTNPEGLWHRVDTDGIQDGPALFYPSGRQYWFFNGGLHRLDGPAAIYPPGVFIYTPDYSEEWYLDDEELTQEQWAQDPRVIEFHSQTQEGAEEWLKSL